MLWTAHTQCRQSKQLQSRSVLVATAIERKPWFHDDNYFALLRDLWPDFRSNAGSRGLHNGALPQLYDTLLTNATARVGLRHLALNFL